MCRHLSHSKSTFLNTWISWRHLTLSLKRELFLSTLQPLTLFFVFRLYGFISSSCRDGHFDTGNQVSPKINALELFCNCLTKRVSSVADSDFDPVAIFVDFDNTVEFLRDTAIKLIHVMYPQLENSAIYTGNSKQKMEKAEAVSTINKECKSIIL